MLTRALLVTAGLLAASFTAAHADSVTASVMNWDAANRTITLDDKTMFVGIPAKTPVPELKTGDAVTVDFDGDENGVAAVNSVTIAKELPPPAKRG